MEVNIDSWGACGAVLLYKLLNVPAEEAGNILGDYLRSFRVKNLERLYQKHCEIKKERELADAQLRSVPPNVGVPLLEAASLETHDPLREIWARLLTNATDPNFKEEIRSAYIDVIKGLSPTDARLLQYFHNHWELTWLNRADKSATEQQRKNLNRQDFDQQFNAQNICKDLKLDNTDYILSIHNLMRVQCVTTPKPRLIPTHHEQASNVYIAGVQAGSYTTYTLVDDGFNVVELTPFGYAFIMACIASPEMGNKDCGAPNL